MLKPFRIGTLELPANVILAPMAGVTDILFRTLIRGLGGCALSYSELISVEGIVRKQPKTIQMMDHPVDEKPFGIQLYGARVETMTQAAVMAVAAGADLIDINAGCPAHKVVRSRGGAFLLKNPTELATILNKVRQTVQVPVTLKIRSGFTPETINFLEIGRMAQDLGIDAVTLHPRTRDQMFTGRANWEQIRQLKETLTIPVIGNGDIFTPADAAAMLTQTGCDAVMIGRGIMRNPWLIRQTADFLATGRFTELRPIDSLKICLHLVRAVAAEKHSKKTLGEMKKFCNWLVHDFTEAAHHRRCLLRSGSPEELLLLLEQLVADPVNTAFPEDPC